LVNDECEPIATHPVIEDSPDGRVPEPPAARDEVSDQRPNLYDRLNELERNLIMEALKATQGNQTQAARVLGVTERVMGLRIRKYRIDPRAFRQARTRPLAHHANVGTARPS